MRAIQAGLLCQSCGWKLAYYNNDSPDTSRWYVVCENDSEHCGNSGVKYRVPTVELVPVEQSRCGFCFQFVTAGETLCRDCAAPVVIPEDYYRFATDTQQALAEKWAITGRPDERLMKRIVLIEREQNPTNLPDGSVMLAFSEITNGKLAWCVWNTKFRIVPPMECAPVVTQNPDGSLSYEDGYTVLMDGSVVQPPFSDNSFMEFVPVWGKTGGSCFDTTQHPTHCSRCRKFIGLSSFDGDVLCHECGELRRAVDYITRLPEYQDEPTAETLPPVMATLRKSDDAPQMDWITVKDGQTLLNGKPVDWCPDPQKCAQGTCPTCDAADLLVAVDELCPGHGLTCKVVDNYVRWQNASGTIGYNMPIEDIAADVRKAARRVLAHFGIVGQSTEIVGVNQLPGDDQKVNLECAPATSGTVLHWGEQHGRGFISVSCPDIQESDDKQSWTLDPSMVTCERCRREYKLDPPPPATEHDAMREFFGKRTKL